MPRPSLETRDSCGSLGRSPFCSTDEASRKRQRPDSYFSLGQDSGQYVQLPKRNGSPGSNVRSGRESTYTLASLYQSKTLDADTQALVDRRAGEIAQWHVHWTTPALIASLFLAGLVAAISHHLFYASLDGSPATEQLKMVRYGTALAFFVKSTLVGTVITCNRQRIWYTFRRKAMTINGIDGLFSATEDPTQFFLNWEMIRNGKLATLMAVSTWLIPIASVLSPASLTSEARTVTNATTCPDVANLNFTREAYFNFRQEIEFDGRGTSIVYYNTTDRDRTTDDYFDYYDQPSRNARRLAFSAAYLKKPQSLEKAKLTSCGEAWNCTYSINFLGPGYKCEDISHSTTSGAPFQLSQIAPQGNFTYFSEVDLDDYQRPQIPSDDGIPIQDPPYPDLLGVFQTEPILWIGYANKTSDLYDPASPYAKKWKYVHEAKMFKCVMHHTNYTFEMKYQPRQSASLKQRDFLHPVINTTLESNPNNASAWVATPASSFVRPKEAREDYKLVAAYHSMGALLRAFLRGNIEKKADDLIITRSDISETRLINGNTSYPQPELMTDVQNVFEDMLITLLSEPALVLAETETVPCEKTRVVVVFVYYARGLWLGYAIVIAVTVVFIFVGGWSLYRNGVASDVLFSRILATTRNPTLDHLSIGACLGGDPFPPDLIKTKLRFGVLLEDDPREGPLGRIEHCCFGTLGETKDIVKGGTYAGLLKKRGRAEQEEGATREEKETLLEKHE